MTTSRWIGLVTALVFLNVSLTFRNVWPTLNVSPSGDLSPELAIVALGLVLAWRWSFARFRATRRCLSVLWVVLVVGRYLDVTTRSLYGHDVNLFWDLQHLPNVGAMFAVAVDPWVGVGIVSGLLLTPLLIYAAARSAFGCVLESTHYQGVRRMLGGLALVVLVLSVARGAGSDVAAWARFSEPVTPVYARELSELAYEMSGVGVPALTPAPDLRSNLAYVNGADVFLIFLESYGAVSWDNPELATALADSRAHLNADIEATGRFVVSARVESTTFGGESWLAHISLLSGTEVRDPGTNKRLLAQDRDTLVRAFGRREYRTVAVMPGLQRGWPQGGFYGFDEIYDLARLDYQGPPFGWWGLNDQFALARVDQLEVAAQPRPPVFVFFPTITTHAPFVPTPPYQPDWARVLSAAPYDVVDLNRAWSDSPDWLNLGPSYVKALTYAYGTIGGYLQLRSDRDFILILVGDHQPPSLVSGEGVSWDVPVHVVASRRPVLDRLQHHRFVEGLTPPLAPIARMDTLLPIFLEAFGDLPQQ